MRFIIFPSLADQPFGRSSVIQQYYGQTRKWGKQSCGGGLKRLQKG
jgi:hypothetical protein